MKNTFEVEIENLRYLYEYWLLDTNEGWAKISELDKNILNTLNCAGLVDMKPAQGYVRISESGVGAVLFGISKQNTIDSML